MDRDMPKLRLICYAIAALSSAPLQGQSPPLVDHHQHLFSPATSARAPGLKPVAADDLIRFLDEAGIRRAVVLSVAYQPANPNRPPETDEYAKVRAENDWTSKEVARFPERLRGFCGVDPLKEYALEEIARCAHDPQLHFGLKLHFGNSDVDLLNPQHVEKLRAVFRAANANRMAIVMHMRPSVTLRRRYGAEQAQSLLNDVIPEAPDVAIQIAHLAGAGGYDDPSVDRAVEVFVDAIAKGDVRTTHLYFDVSGVAGLGRWTEKAQLIASRIRQLGVQRVLYGSDGTADLLRPREACQRFDSFHCRMQSSEQSKPTSPRICVDGSWIKPLIALALRSRSRRCSHFPTHKRSIETCRRRTHRRALTLPCKADGNGLMRR
jgi:predicted TIM-barrel fold metal-dependent hydrolase